MVVIIAILFAYLCGSLNSAIIVCKLMNLPDPRDSGSKNPGTTNVLRVGGKKAAAIVLFLDAFKGLLPIVAAKIFLSDPLAIGMVGLAAVLGHMYPLFFKFAGGKGVATFIGVLFAIHWAIGLIFIAVWLGMAKIFRYSSLAALTATALSPFVAWAIVGSGYILPLFITALFIIYRHSENIKRLIKKSEPKIGSSP